MKLTELSSGPSFLKLLLYGPSGAGKTTSVAALAAEGSLEIWDWDHKVSSAAFHYKNQPEILENIEVYQFAQLPEKDRIPAWLARTTEIDKLIADKKPLPFKTLVLDSLTTFTNALMRDYMVRSYVSTKRPGPDIFCQQDYGVLNTQLTNFIPKLLALPCNVVVIGHMETETDQATGVIHRQPMMPGKNAPKLPIWFEEVWVATLDSKGNRVFQTQPDTKYQICRTQRGLAKEVPMDILKIIKGQ